MITTPGAHGWRAHARPGQNPRVCAPHIHIKTAWPGAFGSLGRGIRRWDLGHAARVGGANRRRIIWRITSHTTTEQLWARDDQA